MKKALTLLELITVVIIVAILASISLPMYNKTVEKALDSDAKTNLKLIIAAENIYYLEHNSAYASNTVAGINDNLRLSIPDVSSPKWTYAVTANGRIATATATRNGDNNRVWTFDTGSDEPRSN